MRLLKISVLTGLVLAAVVSNFTTLAQEDDEICGARHDMPSACRMFGQVDGSTSSDEFDLLQFSSRLFPTEDLAKQYLEDSRGLFSEFPGGEVGTSDYGFGDEHFIVLMESVSDPEDVFASVEFRVDSRVASWTASGRITEPFVILNEIYLAIQDHPETAFASDRELVLALLPELDDIPAEFELIEEVVLGFSETASSESGAPIQDIDQQTVEIMNNLDAYVNRDVTIQGEVYRIGEAQDQTVLVLTDGETYFFNVVYDQRISGVEVGDTVLVTGVLLEQTLEGTPLVRASNVREV